jgi:CrcB protein
MVSVGVSMGAIAGALLRFGIQRAWNVASTHPYGTLMVNVLGSFVIGFLAGFFSGRDNYTWYYTLTAGFCGSFTTFSSISLEILDMLRIGAYVRAVGYVGLTVLLGVIAVALGWWIGMRWRG